MHCSTCWLTAEVNHNTEKNIKGIFPPVWLGAIGVTHESSWKLFLNKMSLWKLGKKKKKKAIWREAFSHAALVCVFCSLAFKEAGGGRKYYWMVKQHVCACVYFCWIRWNLKSKKKSQMRESKREKGGAHPLCLQLKRLNFISLQNWWHIFAYPM